MLSFCNIIRTSGRKQVDEILKIINDSQFPFEKCRDLVKNAQSRQSFVNEQLRNNFEKDGFRKLEVEEECSGIHYTYYHKDVLTVLRNQISWSNSSNSFFHPITDTRGNERIIFNLMSAHLGHTAVEAVRREIETSEDSVIGKTMSRHGVDSFLGLGQLYSDKSSTTLKARGFTFYPLHLVLLNYSTELRQKLIASGMTVAGYLPVKFYYGEDEMSGTKVNTANFREVRLEAIHRAIEKILQPLAAIAKMGFDCVDSSGIHRNFHFALGSYCCDIPEAKDMTGVLNGQKAKATCFRCLIPTESLRYSQSASLRTQRETMDILEKVAELRKEATLCIEQCDKSSAKEMSDISKLLWKEKSLAGVPPVLHKFPFTGLVPSLDIFAIFSLEPMHNLHLGISKLIKVALVERLKDESLKSTVFKTANGSNRSFPSIRFVVLSGANEILRRIQIESYARNLKVDFSNSMKGGRYNGFFTEDGIIGMLEAREYKAIDMVFPFIAGYIDRSCGEVETCPTTRVAVMYSNIVSTACRRGRREGWTTNEIKNFSALIIKFKKLLTDVYENYQSSGMGTLKNHLLDHLSEDIVRLGTLEVMDAGLFEYSHTLFKKKYTGTSRRLKTAMDESIREIERSEVYSKHFQSGLDPERTKPNKNKSRVVTKTAVLTRDGPTFSIKEVRDEQKMRAGRQDLRKDARTSNSCGPTTALHQILEEIGNEAATSLISMLQNWWARTVGGPMPESRRLFRRVTSAYVAGGFVPKACELHPSSNEIREGKCEMLIENRIVAAYNFCGNQTFLQDCILIADDRAIERGTLQVGKALLFLRMKSSNDGSHPAERCLVFFQSFEAIPPDDEIDRHLGSLKLQWAREISNQDSLPIRKFCLEPVDAIRGSLNVITKIIVSIT